MSSVLQSKAWGGGWRQRWPQAQKFLSSRQPSQLLYQLPVKCLQRVIHARCPSVPLEDLGCCWQLKYSSWWCLLPLSGAMVRRMSRSAPPVWCWCHQPVQCLPRSVHHQLWLAGYHWVHKTKLHVKNYSYGHSTSLHWQEEHQSC